MGATSHIRRPTTGISFCGSVSARTPPVGVKVYELEDKSQATCTPCKLLLQKLMYTTPKAYRPAVFIRRKKRK